MMSACLRPELWGVSLYVMGLIVPVKSLATSPKINLKISRQSLPLRVIHDAHGEDVSLGYIYRSNVLRWWRISTAVTNALCALVLLLKIKSRPSDQAKIQVDGGILEGWLDLCVWKYWNSSCWWWLKSPGVVWVESRNLSSKSVQSSALSLEGIDNIKCCHCLAASVLSVGDCIPDHVLQEHLEDASSLLIDQARDTLDASATSQSPDCWLCDSLDVVSQHLSVSLGTSFSCKGMKLLRTKRSTYDCLMWVYYRVKNRWICHWENMHGVLIK